MSTMPDDLAARVRRIEDRFALQDLVVRYFNACDEEDYDALAETFATDAEFADAYGRDQVVEILREDRSTMGTTIHSPDSMLFTFTGEDTATGVIGAHCELARGGASLYGAMRYVDEYVRERGDWRILRREIRLFHIGPWTEIAESLTGDTPVRWPGRPPAPADLPAAWRAVGASSPTN